MGANRHYVDTASSRRSLINLRDNSAECFGQACQPSTNTKHHENTHYYLCCNWIVLHHHKQNTISNDRKRLQGWYHCSVPAMRQIDGSACFNCKYWSDRSSMTEKSFASCLRYAPRPEPTVDRIDIKWPMTWGEAWCGEWEARL